MDDPNESTSTVEAWREIAAKVGMHVERTETWVTAISSGTADSLLSPQYPFGVRNDLHDATPDQWGLVGATLRELIAATAEWQAVALFVELRNEGGSLARGKRTSRGL